MTSSLIAVRPAKADDIPLLSAMASRMTDFHHRLDPFNLPGIRTLEAHKEYFARIIGEDDAYCYVLLSGTHIAGYATARIREMNPYFVVPRIGHIENIYVDPRYRRMGLSRFALEKLFADFKARGVTYADLSVDVRNASGVEAWKDAGFEKWRYIMRRKL